MKEYKLFMAGYSYEEIASTVGKPIGLVKATIFSERMRLKRKRLELFKSINKPS